MVRWATLAMAALAAVVLADRGPAADDYAAWRPLLAGELADRNVREPDDLYKFLYQGVMGPAHAAPDSAEIAGWLAREWAEAAGVPAAGRPPLLVPLRPDGRLVRVDLVRLRERAGAGADSARTRLGAAQMVTMRRWRGDPAEVARLWGAVCADSALWAGWLEPDSLAAFTRMVADAGWPTVHHGPTYVRQWAPHYRVVDAAELPAAWRRSP